MGSGLTSAQQKIGLHGTLAFDVNATVQLEPKVFFQMLIGGCRDLDAVRCAVRFHTTGDVYCIPPNIVDKFVSSYDAGHYVAGMNADTHLQSDGDLAIQPLDGLNHSQ